MQIKFKIKKAISILKSGSTLSLSIFNTGWLFVDRIMRMAVELFVSIWVARYLGSQQFGLFNYAIAFVALFNAISTLGLDSIVVRSLVLNPEDKEKILGTTFFLKLLGGVFVFLLSCIAIFVLRHDNNLTILLVIILSSTFIFQSLNTVDFWFQSQLESKYTIFAKSSAFIIANILKVNLIVFQAPLIAFGWVAFTEILLASVGLFFAYQVRGYSLWTWRLNFKEAKVLLRESWPLILSSLSVIVYFKIDQIMLGEMIGDEAVGIYSAATRISEVWYFIPMAIVASVAPSIYSAKESSEALYYQRIEKLIRLLVLISIIIALPISFMSGAIVSMTYGNVYAEAGNILSIHIWASLLVFMGVATSCWFIAEGLSHLSLVRTFIGASTNVLLNLFLIPKYSGVGAAVATLISYTCADFLMNATHPKTKKIFKIQIKSLLFIKTEK
jgi:polysaccharide transporter, PST family